MGRAWSLFHKHRKSAVLALALALAVFGPAQAYAQNPPQPCDNETDADTPDVQCPPGIPLDPNGFEMSQAVPLVDGNTQLLWPPLVSAIGHQETVALYGAYGNDERTPTSGPAWDHYVQGVTEAGNIHAINGAIVFLFIGFSNCRIEICGGDMDIWPGDPNTLQGQPCSTPCPNPRKISPSSYQPWNQAGDGITQRSFMYQVYSPQQHLVGNHVYVFDGAKGHETLARWDPNGFYLNNNCAILHENFHDPECNYKRVIQDLEANGFDRSQVQAVFIKMSTGGPRCDLSGFHCAPGVTEADAYTSERYLGNILRYLKQGYNGNPVRFPNIHQVFISSRTYGGYAQAKKHNACNLNPEPYAYEEGFAVQRLIVAQINHADDGYSGPVDYDHAPWVDWGPYLWTNGDRPRQTDGLVWCNNNQPPSQCSNHWDVRYGDLDQQYQSQFWGDLTHPTFEGQGKVANQLVNFISDSYSGPHFVQPWIHQ